MIELQQNFRSRESVLTSVNDVFLSNYEQRTWEESPIRLRQPFIPARNLRR